MDITDKDLEAQIQELKKEQDRRHDEKVKAKRQFLLDHIDAVLELTPDHSRTSCSDENQSNWGRCVRCTLLEIKSTGFNDLWVVDSIGLMKELCSGERDPFEE